MDESARKSARTRAVIAFALAGVLLVVNVALALAWREERRDRFDGDRIELDQRMQDDLRGQPPMGPGGGQGVPGDRGDMPMGPGGDRSDDEDRSSAPRDGGGPDDQDRSTARPGAGDDTDQDQQEGAA